MPAELCIAEAGKPRLFGFDEEFFNAGGTLGIVSIQGFEFLFECSRELTVAIGEERINLLQLEISLLGQSLRDRQRSQNNINAEEPESVSRMERPF